MAAAVVTRHWRERLRYPLPLALGLVEPFLWVAASLLLASAFTQQGVAPGFASYTGSHAFGPFLLAGTLFSGFLSSFSLFGYRLQGETKRGTVEAVFLGPASRLSYLAGMAVATLTDNLLEILASIALAVLVFGVTPAMHTSPAIVLVLLLGSVILAFGLGLVVAAVILLVKDPGAVTWGLTVILPILIGQGYGIQVLPRSWQAVSRLLPYTYALDAWRAVLAGTSPMLPLGLQLVVVAGGGILVLAAGLLAFSALERVARSRGTLGQF